jgi:hypothetical protein
LLLLLVVVVVVALVPLPSVCVLRSASCLHVVVKGADRSAIEAAALLPSSADKREG